MKLTNKQLKQLIKEELQNILLEDREIVKKAMASWGPEGSPPAPESPESLLQKRLLAIEQRLDKLELKGPEKTYWQ